MTEQRWQSYRSVPGQKLRTLKVYGVLALVALACELLLLLIMGPPPPYQMENPPPVVFREGLRWLVVFWSAAAISTLVGAIAWAWFHRPDHKWPGLKTGIAVVASYALLFGAMAIGKG
jgi:hypothetical protein